MSRGNFDDVIVIKRLTKAVPSLSCIAQIVCELLPLRINCCKCAVYVFVCLFVQLTVVLLLVVGDSVYLQILYTKEMKLNTCSVLLF